MKKYFLLLFPAVALSMGFIGFLLSPTAQAAPAGSCGGRYPVQIEVENTEVVMCCPTGSTDRTSCLIKKYIDPTIRLLAVAGGVAAIGGIIWGGIQYASSAGDAGKVAKGKQTIIRALTGLVALLVLAPFLSFMLPAATGATDCKAQRFMGIKPWYAYVEDQYIEPDCSIKRDAPLVPAGQGSGTGNGILAPIALAVVDGLVRIAAVVALVFVIIGGLKYMMSQGEPAQTKTAMSSILNALIGLAVAIFAAVIVSFIGRALT